MPTPAHGCGRRGWAEWATMGSPGTFSSSGERLPARPAALAPRWWLWSWRETGYGV